MSRLAPTAPPRRRRRPSCKPATTRSASVRVFGGITLEQRILEAWEGLHAGATAECVVCGGPLHRHGCGDCGARID